MTVYHSHKTYELSNCTVDNIFYQRKFRDICGL